MTTEPLDLDAIEARASAATRGPWQTCGADRSGCACNLVWSLALDTTVACTSNIEPSDLELPQAHCAGNAAFIAHARTDVPALVAEVRRLRDALVYADECCDAMKLEANSAEAEVERLKEQVAEAKSESQSMFERSRRYQERAEAAEAEVARLREALGKYGMHSGGCGQRMPDDGPCYCGLDAALGAK